MSDPVKYANGCHIWYDDNNTQVHRIDGPAKTWPCGSEEWYNNSKPHRLDGPAIKNRGIAEEWVFQWYVNGKRIRSINEYQSLTKLSDEEMTMLILKYGNIK